MKRINRPHLSVFFTICKTWAWVWDRQVNEIQKKHELQMVLILFVCGFFGVILMRMKTSMSNFSLGYIDDSQDSLLSIEHILPLAFYRFADRSQGYPVLHMEH